MEPFWFTSRQRVSAEITFQSASQFVTPPLYQLWKISLTSRGKEVLRSIKQEKGQQRKGFSVADRSPRPTSQVAARLGGWAGSNQCLGSCDVQYGGQYSSTEGFQQAQCDGEIQTRNKVGFWCDWGAVMMIGGGGRSCDRADHGIGITEVSPASFTGGSLAEYDFGYNEDAGGDSHQPSPWHALNLWVR